MPAPKDRDLVETRGALRSWLARQIPAASEFEVGELSGPSATGFSSDTLIFDASWQEGGERVARGMVARLKPTGYQVFPHYDVGAQARVMATLGEKTDIPVPEILWSESDESILGVPFYVMARVDGRVPTDNPPYHSGGWVAELPPEERGALWSDAFDVMARIHRLDWRALDLDFLETDAPGESHLEKQLRYYEHYLEWATKDRRNELVEGAMQWLWAHRPSEAEPVGLCWGDARIGNMIFREGRCVAVLDWEMATLGNPEQDLAWALFLDRHHSEGIGVARLPGFPSREETISRYEARTDCTVKHLRYYEIFAAARFAVIMMRLGQQMVHYELIPADSRFEIDNTVTNLLSRLLDEAS